MQLSVLMAPHLDVSKQHDHSISIRDNGRYSKYCTLVIIICQKYIIMLQTDYKLEQFVNRSPVYELVIQFLNWLACF